MKLTRSRTAPGPSNTTVRFEITLDVTYQAEHPGSIVDALGVPDKEVLLRVLWATFGDQRDCFMEPGARFKVSKSKPGSLLKKTKRAA